MRSRSVELGLTFEKNPMAVEAQYISDPLFEVYDLRVTLS